MSVCIDSSFLVSSYLSDSNSLETDRRRATKPDIWITPLNRSEFAYALYQQVFRGRMNLAEASHVWALFERDCDTSVWVQVSLPDSVWRISVELARQHGPIIGMRTLDSLHVACALALKANRFWTFDERQTRLAEAAGLNTQV